jgi:hypothetical protein
MASERPNQTTGIKALPWRIFQTIMWLAIPALPVVLLQPLWLRHHPESRWRSDCKNSIKQIVLALHNYHDAFQTLPPPYTLGPDGQKLHSWRTLILPYLTIDRYDDSQSSAEFYDQIRLDEPWDSTHNFNVEQQFGKSIRKFFHCQSDPLEEGKPQQDVSYLAVVGPRTIWNTEKPIGFSSVVDGSSNTIAIVETADTGVFWMEPRDLHVDQMSSKINDLRGQGLSSYHENESRTKFAGGVNVGMLDGVARWIPVSLPSSTLQDLLLIDDGNGIGDF